MDAEELHRRAKKAALTIFQLVDSHAGVRLSTEIVSRQLVRSATSVASNYRAACRAKSHRDFVYKLSVVVEEADESVFWLEMLRDGHLLAGFDLSALIDEYGQLLRIFSASHKTAKSTLKNTASTNQKINKSINRKSNQSTSHSVIQSASASISHSTSTSINKSTSNPINQ